MSQVSISTAVHGWSLHQAGIMILHQEGRYLADGHSREHELADSDARTAHEPLQGIGQEQLIKKALPVALRDAQCLFMPQLDGCKC
jgi:hypothetical protein